jgi:multiple sugar transport system substrate-binding protein
MATMKDVARLAGVSHATVSNVINNPNKVKLETVKKVEKAMNELEYQPDATARGLRSNKTKNIGVVLPNITDHFYAQIFSGIERVLSEKKYTASLYITSEVPTRERDILNTIQQNRMDGLIISTCQPDNTQLFYSLSESKLEMVFLDREIKDSDFNFIGFNNFNSFYDISLKLLNNNYNPIAIVTGPEIYSSEKRCLDGYLKALNKENCKVNKDLIKIIDINKENAFKTGVELFQITTVPEAILTSSTEIARGIMESLTIYNYKLNMEPLIISLGENTWTNNNQGKIIIEREASLLGTMSAEILIEDIQKPVFSEPRYILLDNTDVYLEKRKITPVKINTDRKKETQLNVLMLESSAAYATSSLLPDFEKREHISVNIDVCKYDRLYEIIKEEAKQERYDVFQVDLPWIAEFVERDFLFELDNYINDNPDSIKGLIPGILDVYAKYNHNFYALPYMYGSQLLYYRKDIFEDLKIQRQFYEKYNTELKIPENWTEYNVIAKFFTKKYNPESPTKYGTTLGGSFSSAAICEFLPRLWGYSGACFDQEGNVSLDNQEAVKALKNYAESYNYASPGSIDYLWDEQVKEFSAGDAAMMVLFVAHATEIVNKSKSDVVGKIGYSIIPGGAPLLGGWSVGINNRSQKKEAAFKFISWSCNEKLAIPYTILGGATPCLNLYKSSELLTIYPWLSRALESFSISRKRTLPQPKNGVVVSERKFEEIMGTMIQRVIKGDLQPETGIKLASEKLIKLLK